MMCLNNLLRRMAALAVAMLTACGGGSSAPLPDPLPVQDNEIRVTVDSGPSGPIPNVNRLYATVTICHPGSLTQCITVDHVLVDTGSNGLRLLSSAIAANSPGFSLNRVVTRTGGLPLLNCVQFVDNTFAWGPVVMADIVLGKKRAASVPIQVIADPDFRGLAASCSTATEMTTPAELGANGILGVGLSKKDCWPDCLTNPANGFYFTCAERTCSAAGGSIPSIALLEQQVTNPVSMFASDNNGVLIALPPVSAVADSLTGSLIFGINTQTNNQLESLASTAAVLTASAFHGFITTRMTLPGSNGRALTLPTSFIDSGSNGYFFYSNSRAIQSCPIPNDGFFCPAALTSVSATLQGANGTTKSVSFSISNALEMFGNNPRPVLPNLSGGFDETPPSSFDWGLPFFYGRRVFVGIEGMAPAGPGAGDPFYAF